MVEGYEAAHFDLEKVFRGSVDLLEGLLAGLRDRLHGAGGEDGQIDGQMRVSARDDEAGDRISLSVERRMIVGPWLSRWPLTPLSVYPFTSDYILD